MAFHKIQSLFIGISEMWWPHDLYFAPWSKLFVVNQSALRRMPMCGTKRPWKQDKMSFNVNSFIYIFRTSEHSAQLSSPRIWVLSAVLCCAMAIGQRNLSSADEHSRSLTRFAEHLDWIEIIIKRLLHIFNGARTRLHGSWKEISRRDADARWQGEITEEHARSFARTQHTSPCNCHFPFCLFSSFSFIFSASSVSVSASAPSMIIIIIFDCGVHVTEASEFHRNRWHRCHFAQNTSAYQDLKWCFYYYNFTSQSHTDSSLHISHVSTFVVVAWIPLSTIHHTTNNK